MPFRVLFRESRRRAGCGKSARPDLRDIIPPWSHGYRLCVRRNRTRMNKIGYSLSTYRHSPRTAMPPAFLSERGPHDAMVFVCAATGAFARKWLCSPCEIWAYDTLPCSTVSQPERWSGRRRTVGRFFPIIFGSRSSTHSATPDERWRGWWSYHLATPCPRRCVHCRPERGLRLVPPAGE